MTPDERTRAVALARSLANDGRQSIDALAAAVLSLAADLDAALAQRDALAAALRERRQRHARRTTFRDGCPADRDSGYRCGCGADDFNAPINRALRAAGVEP